MNKKQDGKLVMGLVILLAVLVLSGKLSLPKTQPTNEQEDVAIQTTLYDKTGRPVKTLSIFRPFSIVEGTPDISFFSHTIVVNNKGQLPLDVSLESVTPTQFDEALTKNTLTVEPGKTIFWKTENSCESDTDCGASESCVNSLCLIRTEPFETMPQPVVFKIKVKADFTCPTGSICQTSEGQVSGGQKGTLYKQAERSLTILSTGYVQVDFTVDITSSVGGGECLASGTACSSNDQCCGLNCQGSTTETKEVVYAKTRTTRPRFTCSVSYDRCELYQVETKTGASTWDPIVPVLVDTCLPGGVCGYMTSVQHGYEGYGILSETTRSCA